ncbi:hypothetical protein GCM10009665_41860 [Kitasatospora nipponensis]|uniref:Uncharacterized protein n=1 Tax=Kitasatospora nipponensis TaxID=258049 RepID=A0ABN1WJK8_9ACTN
MAGNRRVAVHERPIEGIPLPLSDEPNALASRGRTAPAGRSAGATVTIEDQQADVGDIVTQPGFLCVVGDDICMSRENASPITPDYRAPFRFTGCTLDRSSSMSPASVRSSTRPGSVSGSRSTEP